MDMNKQKNFLVAGMAVVLVLAPAAFASPQQGKLAKRRAALAQLFSAKQFVKGLNLTDDQKIRIKQSIADHEAEVKEVRLQTLMAHLAVLKGDANGAASAQAAARSIPSSRVAG